MTHKAYTARVELDDRDGIFVGRILGIRTIISFHGETVAELRTEFETAVEDYLAECIELGVNSEKPAWEGIGRGAGCREKPQSVGHRDFTACGAIR